MKTLHAYLTRQVLATLLMTVMVFTFVLLLGNVLNEIMVLLVNQDVTLWLVVQAVALLIPYVLVFALPMGMLTAALLVFGRFSADQELTAARAGGISLLALITPILLIALLLSGLCAWINLQIAPQARVAYKELIFRVGMERPTGLLREGQYVQDIPGGYTIFVKKIRGAELQEVKVYQSDAQRDAQSWYHAPSGTLSFDAEQQALLLTLFDAYGAERQSGQFYFIPHLGEVTMSIELGRRAQLPDSYKPKLSEMTFQQLQGKLRELNALFLDGTGGQPDAESAIQLARLEQDMIMPVKVQLHRQVAFSFACIGFTLIGVPLGVRAHRRETMIGVAVALALVFVYYGFVIVGQVLDTRPEWFPHLIVWIPNFIFQVVGGWLLWRANSKV
jgi:lipopolysaccharide export LptBFGC system permease protein LptF